MFNWDNFSSRPSEKPSFHDFDTLQKVRRDLVGEWEAIMGYDLNLATDNNSLARATWEDIRNEELVHVGELMGLLFYLAPYQKKYIQQGMEEFEKRATGRGD